MNRSMRLISVLIAIGAVSTQFVNCGGGTSDGNLFGGGGDSVTASSTDTTQGSYLQAKNMPPRMECTQDHIQIGGICDVSGSEDNYIEYSLTNRSGAAIPWASGAQNVFVLQEGQCVNGRYFLIVPRPPDSFITTAQQSRCQLAVGCYEEYRLNSRIYVRRKGLRQFELLQSAPVLPLSIQLIINNACPPAN